MKKILRDTCLLASLIILVVFGLSIIWSGITAEMKLVFEIFGLAFIISVANFIFDEYVPLSIIVSYIIKFFLISGIVMLFGFIVGWFFPSNFWMVFIYVGVVLVMGYLLDSFKIKKDIDYINQRIKNKTESTQKV
ncbi:MAG: DUF3021 family protein [Lachnospiraceae bacterium]|nr:DUF3021 family protein [Lachnospiraceae bacterium]MBP5275247.1 DUF3021 family protein [Lachnospiraceae bacterium]